MYIIIPQMYNTLSIGLQSILLTMKIFTRLQEGFRTLGSRPVGLVHLESSSDIHGSLHLTRCTEKLGLTSGLRPCATLSQTEVY
jgi:hypothetical protein